MQFNKEQFRLVYDWWKKRNIVILWSMVGAILLISLVFERFTTEGLTGLTYLVMFLWSLPLLMCAITGVDKNRNNKGFPYYCFGYYIILGFVLFVYIVLAYGEQVFIRGETPAYLKIARDFYLILYVSAIPCFYLCFLDRERAQLYISNYRSVIVIISIIVSLVIARMALFYFAPGAVSDEKLLQFRVNAFIGIGTIGTINIILTITKMILDYYHYKLNHI